jgi:threonine/homoserine/homoserine lactone efflux protein
MACGFCFAMVDVNTRQALFVRPRFRFLYLSFFTVLLLIIGGNLGLFEGPSLALLLGVLAGAFIAWLALRLLRTQQAKQP